MTALDEYFPFDAGAGADVAEAEWRKMAALWAPSAVIGNTNDELEVYADSSGMQVKVRAGACWVKGHYGGATSEKTVAISNGNGSNPRKDLIVARATFASNTVSLEVVEGTPAASPSRPAVTQSASVWEIPLAEVTVPTAESTAIDAGDVTADLRVISTPGDSGSFSYTPVVQYGGTTCTVGNGVIQGRISYVGGGLAYVRVAFQYGSTTNRNGGTGDLTFSLPPGWTELASGLTTPRISAGTAEVRDDSASAVYGGYFTELQEDEKLRMRQSSTAVGGTTVSHTAPVTVATGDTFVCNAWILLG